MLYVVIGAVIGLTLLAMLLRAQQNLEKIASQEAQKEIEALKTALEIVTKRIENLEIIATEGETQILNNSSDLLDDSAPNSEIIKVNKPIQKQIKN